MPVFLGSLLVDILISFSAYLFVFWVYHYISRGPCPLVERCQSTVTRRATYVIVVRFQHTLWFAGQTLASCTCEFKNFCWFAGFKEMLDLICVWLEGLWSICPFHRNTAYKVRVSRRTCWFAGFAEMLAVICVFVWFEGLGLASQEGWLDHWWTQMVLDGAVLGFWLQPLSLTCQMCCYPSFCDIACDEHYA